MYTYISIHIHIYIYRERESERERDRDVDIEYEPLCVPPHMERDNLICSASVEVPSDLCLVVCTQVLMLLGPQCMSIAYVM